MSKKRATWSSTKEKHQNLLEYEFNKDPEDISQNNKPLSKQKEERKPKRLNSRSQTQQLSLPRQQQSPASKAQSNSLSSKPLQIKKKKVSKQEQNEGLRIIKQRQTQNIFRHFCTPEGVITVESLGSVLVRAKKEFETEDVENMIAYFETVKRKMEEEVDVPVKDRKNGNKRKEQEEKSQSIKSKRNKNKPKPRLQRRQSSDSQDSISVASVSQSDEQRSIDQEMDMMDQQQPDMKTELNYEEFKLLLKYFDKE